MNHQLSINVEMLKLQELFIYKFLTIFKLIN